MQQQPFIYDQPQGRIGSGWKQPIGKVLTNHRIGQLMREGHYGPLYKLPPLTRGYCQTPGCGQKDHTKFKTMSYLPKSGVYCPACLAKYKNEHLLEQELKRRLAEVRREEFDVTNWEGLK